MIDYLTNIAPIIIALIIYFMRLETRIAEILNDLCWIKKELAKCRPS